MYLEWPIVKIYTRIRYSELDNLEEPKNKPIVLLIIDQEREIYNYFI